MIWHMTGVWCRSSQQRTGKAVKTERMSGAKDVKPARKISRILSFRASVWVPRTEYLREWLERSLDD